MFSQINLRFKLLWYHGIISTTGKECQLFYNSERNNDAGIFMWRDPQNGTRHFPETSTELYKIPVDVPKKTKGFCSTLKTFLHCNRKYFNLNCDTKIAQFVKNQAKYIEFEINIGNLLSQILAICGWSVLKNGFLSTNQVTQKHSH